MGIVVLTEELFSFSELVSESKPTIGFDDAWFLEITILSRYIPSSFAVN